MPERELIDPSDGENIAVRSFLAMYGARGLTTPEMRAQMTAAGFPHWPEWADSDPGRLTKHGAQDWLRHLFALETAALAQPVAAEPEQAPHPQAGANPNTGHGWVHKRPDGVVARCGGPKLCKACQAEQSTAPGQPSQDAEDAARWREHVGKLDALVAFCPTCCEGKVASADMTRDEVIFQCGKTSGRIAATSPNSSVEE